MIDSWKTESTASLENAINAVLMVEGEKSAIVKKLRQIIASRQLKVGDRAKIEIGKWRNLHEATITSIDTDKGTCSIQFDTDVLYYDNQHVSFMADPYVRSLDNVNLADLHVK